MPLVSHNKLPAFERLRQSGQFVLESGRALHQHIRELHIGLLNMMPDAALEATERQFFKLVGESNPIAQFYVHPFTLKELPRSERAQRHIDSYYDTFEQLQKEGLDALITSSAGAVDEMGMEATTTTTRWDGPYIEDGELPADLESISF